MSGVLTDDVHREPPPVLLVDARRLFHVGPRPDNDRRRAALEAALCYGGGPTGAARLLGVTPKNVSRLLKAYRIRWTRPGTTPGRRPAW